MNIQELKQVLITDFLGREGIKPNYIRGENWWYLSPLREEKTPSFKVNQKLNVWYDHGIGKGGNIVNLGTLYFGCSVKELLQRISDTSLSCSFHPPQYTDNLYTIRTSPAGEKKENPGSKIVILDSRVLADKSLLNYLQSRGIPQDIGRHFCREVDFLLYGKKQTAIGFENNAGGYELRSPNFKGSSSPKDITFMDTWATSLTVFEGFFDYLSFQAMNDKAGAPLTNFLVLNSLVFFEKSRSLMEKHREVDLYLDRDTAGITCVKKALKWNPNLFKDRSHLYAHHKDLNDQLIHKRVDIKRGLRTVRSI